MHAYVHAVQHHGGPSGHVHYSCGDAAAVG